MKKVVSESELEKLFEPKRLQKLFFLEKERRNASKEKLVFVAIANIAQYYWCAMQSVLKSRKYELGFFASYLHDRIRYSLQLELINRLPKGNEELLQIGNEIGFDEIEKLLKEKGIISFEMPCETSFDKNGNKVMLINPDSRAEDRLNCEALAKQEGIKVANLEEFPKIRGELLESSKAKKYPRIRWNFNWNNYTVVGVPDGITSDFSYEFKTTRSRFLMFFIKRVAFTQADLYGYFFKRGRKKVQIYVVNERKMETWEDKIDEKNTIDTLNNFKKVDEGWIPLPPKHWKCKSCEFRDKCDISKSLRY